MKNNNFQLATETFFSRVCVMLYKNIDEQRMMTDIRASKLIISPFIFHFEIVYPPPPNKFISSY